MRTIIVPPSPPSSQKYTFLLPEMTYLLERLNTIELPSDKTHTSRTRKYKDALVPRQQRYTAIRHKKNDLSCFM